MSILKQFPVIYKFSIGLIAVGLLFSCSDNDDSDGDFIPPPTGGSVTITSFDLSDADYLMIYEGSKKRSRADDTDDNDSDYDDANWGSDPVVVKILSDGSATPVIYATQGENEVARWIPKSITRIHSNYMVFETENTRFFAPFYLVRLNDGKVYEFGFFDIETTYLETGEYLYVFGQFDNVDFSNHIGGPARIYLPSGGTPSIEHISAYKSQIDISTKDYYGSTADEMITGFSSNRSYNLPEYASTYYIGLNYSSNTLFFYHSEIKYNYLIYFLDEYGVRENQLELLSSTELITEWGDYEFPLPTKRLTPALAFGKGDDIFILDETDNYRIWIYNKESETFTDTGHALNIGKNNGLYHNLTVLGENRFQLIDGSNNIHIIDLNQTRAESMFYTLFVASDYNSTYRIRSIEYNRLAAKYYFGATRLADTKQVLLSMEATPGADLIEEQVYDTNISYMVPIN